MKLKILNIVIFLISIPSVVLLYGNDTIKTIKNPVHAQIQYAGNMGLFSVGIGKSFISDKLSICAIYGYLPKEINGVNVHTFALKSSYQYLNIPISDNNVVGIYSGFACMYGITDNTFVNLPEYYPKGYYTPTALHATIFTGAKHTRVINKTKWIKSISFFSELGTVDYKIWYAIKTKYINFSDLWNLCVGITIQFKNK